MSRIGGKVIELKQDSDVSVSDNIVTVKGTLGELSFSLPTGLSCVREDNMLKIGADSQSKRVRAFQGLFRSLIYNAVIGVSEGFSHTLELIGIGYRAQMTGKTLVLNLGYSHPINFESPEGISIKVEGNNKIIITGIDKQAVGQVAANIRSFRPPEPYKGKGVRTEGEHISLKAGKSAKK